MQETLHDHHTSILIGSRPLRNLRFTDNIDLMGGSNQELQALTNSLVDRAGVFGMEVSTEKAKVMVNSTNNSSANITVNAEILEEVAPFKHLGTTRTKDGSSTAEVSLRIKRHQQ